MVHAPNAFGRYEAFPCVGPGAEERHCREGGSEVDGDNGAVAGACLRGPFRTPLPPRRAFCATMIFNESIPILRRGPSMGRWVTNRVCVYHVNIFRRSCLQEEPAEASLRASHGFFFCHRSRCSLREAHALMVAPTTTLMRDERVRAGACCDHQIYAAGLVLHLQRSPRDPARSLPDGLGWPACLFKNASSPVEKVENTPRCLAPSSKLSPGCMSQGPGTED